MATNSEIIEKLEKTQTALEEQRLSASGDMDLKLTTAIDKIADEIEGLEAVTLTDATYVPKTDPFKQETADGKTFVTHLKGLQTAFSDVTAVASALDSVIKIIAKIGV